MVPDRDAGSLNYLGRHVDLLHLIVNKPLELVGELGVGGGGDEADSVVGPVPAVEGDGLGLPPLLALPAPRPVKRSESRVSPGTSPLVSGDGRFDRI